MRSDSFVAIDTVSIPVRHVNQRVKLRGERLSFRLIEPIGEALVEQRTLRFHGNPFQSRYVLAWLLDAEVCWLRVPMVAVKGIEEDLHRAVKIEPWHMGRGFTYTIVHAGCIHPHPWPKYELERKREPVPPVVRAVLAQLRGCHATTAALPRDGLEISK
jgi:hypothetical protein